MDKNVLILAVAFKKRINELGKSFSFPKSDITKTYHYRYLLTFWNKCKEHDLSIDMAEEVMRSIVDYCYKGVSPNAGIAIINRSDIFNICLNNLESGNTDKTDKELVVMNDFINSKTNNRYEYFSLRPKKKSYTNLIVLKNSNIINDNFIALSKSAIRSAINNDELNWLSPMKEYLKIKIRLTSKFGKKRLYEIFGDDLNVN